MFTFSIKYFFSLLHLLHIAGTAWHCSHLQQHEVLDIALSECPVESNLCKCLLMFMNIDVTLFCENSKYKLNIHLPINQSINECLY